MKSVENLIVMNDYSEFGKWIKETRTKKGMTQKELCEKCDVVIEHMSKIENGHRIPSRLLIEKIVDELDYEFVLVIRKKGTDNVCTDNSSKLLSELDCQVEKEDLSDDNVTDSAISEEIDLNKEIEKLNKSKIGGDRFVIEGFILNYGMTYYQALEKYIEIYGK